MILTKFWHLENRAGEETDVADSCQIFFGNIFIFFCYISFNHRYLAPEIYKTQ